MLFLYQPEFILACVALIFCRAVICVIVYIFNIAFFFIACFPITIANVYFRADITSYAGLLCWVRPVFAIVFPFRLWVSCLDDCKYKHSKKNCYDKNDYYFSYVYHMLIAGFLVFKYIAVSCYFLSKTFGSLKIEHFQCAQKSLCVSDISILTKNI